jgi:hypothetical protein
MLELYKDFTNWLDRRRKGDQEKIKFVSTLEGLEAWCPIVPAKTIIPQWYKDLPARKDAPPAESIGEAINAGALPSGCPAHFATMANKTVKHCPGIQDTLTEGYIVPFWGAAVGEVTEDGENIFFHTATNNSAYALINPDDMNYNEKRSANFTRLAKARDEEIWNYLQNSQNSEENINLWRKTQSQQEAFSQFSVHHKQQYESFEKQFPDRWSRAVCKIHSMWRVYTPEGYSTMITPPDYHMTNMSDYMRILYGIVDTDRYHTMNFFFWVMEKGVQFEIPYATPLAHLHVFKRNDLPYEIRSITPEEMRDQRIDYNFTTARFGSAKSYRQMQKMKDNLKKRNNTEILK